MKNIAVIAHNRKKPELAKFIAEHKIWILGINIIATGKTAEYLEENNLEVKHLSQGCYGGYKQIIEMLENKKIDMVIFFTDPTIKEPHHEDIEKLIETCIEKNIPLANNNSSAELLIIGQIKKEEAEKARKFLENKK